VAMVLPRSVSVDDVDHTAALCLQLTGCNVGFTAAYSAKRAIYL